MKIEERIKLLEKEKELLEEILELKKKINEAYKWKEPVPIIQPYPVYPCPPYPCPTITVSDSTSGKPEKAPIAVSTDTYTINWPDDTLVSLTN